MIRLSTLLLLLVLVALPVQAQGVIEITLAHGFRQNPFSVPVAASAWKFKDALESRSNGAIRVNIVPDGQVGSEQQIVRLIKTNVLQSAILSAEAMVPHYAPMAVTLVPFVTTDKTQAAAIYDGDFGQALANDMGRQTSMTVLGFAIEDGVHVITNNRRPIRRVQDAAGLRMAVISGPGFGGALVQALQASAARVSRLDAHSAMDMGLIDGQISSTEEVFGRHYDEVQTFATITDHRHAPMVWLFNKDLYDQLSADQQQAVRQSAREALESGRLVAAKLDADLTSSRKLGRHMDVVSLGAAERKDFRDALLPAMQDAVTEQLDPAAQIWFKHFMAAAGHMVVAP